MKKIILLSFFGISIFAPINSYGIELFAEKPYVKPISADIDCVDANVVVLYHSPPDLKPNYVVIRFDKNTNGKIIKTSTLNNQFDEFDLSKNDMSKFELQCIEDAPGIYIPGKSGKENDLYVIMTKEGRLIQGYNLTGHGFKAK